MPPIIEEIAFIPPQDALTALPARPGLAFLDSAMPHPKLGRWSWLAFDPFGRFTVDGAGIPRWSDGKPGGEATASLQGLLGRFADEPAAVPYAGGATGIVAYEAGHLFERLPTPKPGGEPGPLVDLWFHDCGLCTDLVERRSFLVSTGRPEVEPARRKARARARLVQFRALLSRVARTRAATRIVLPRDAWISDMDVPAFRAAVERVRRYIADGDIFQANIARALTASLPAGFDPLALYAQLRAANPAPFGALIVAPERLVASTSPEGFLCVQNGNVETRPIKGTRPRPSDPFDNVEEDRRLAAELTASEKDRAENVMIVDLIRNDLSRVCRPGSVEVSTLCGLESYANVHHLVSVVRGTLKPGRDAVDLLAACFPGGSITGAPKIRAMEIIHDLEGGPRGVYCGSVVHFGHDGSMRSSIAIRTLTAANGMATVRAGGGITLLSDPEAEWRETETKAERLLAAFDPGPAEAQSWRAAS